MESWYVTFGSDHVLSGGQVRDLGGQAGGLPLGKFFAVIPAETAAQARAKVIELFGPGNWCDIYPKDRGREIALKYSLFPLFDRRVTARIAAMPMCGCREPQHPHCPGWHVDVEG